MKACSASPALERLRGRFERLYGRSAAPACLERLVLALGRYGLEARTPGRRGWDQSDRILIAYPDAVTARGERPLAVLKRFLDRRLAGAFDTLHLLPFFPSSSDEGFSVIHYRTVNPELGNWADVAGLGGSFRLMLDLVLNHVSRQSAWFKEFSTGIAPARDYFIEADPGTDLSAVVRPRSSALLTPVWTRRGYRHVWSTFGPDQIDLNYANPDVFFEILDILLYYVSQGARIIRLDAVAFLWKRIGTPCLNLPETHEIVRIFRECLALAAPDVLLLTETNLPAGENESYFGGGEEAHLIYNFVLPPLLLHALLSGSSRALNAWAASRRPPPPGCACLNFTASHDGIGLRPLEGLLPEAEVGRLVEQALSRGGRISLRAGREGKEAPYELNIAYPDALSLPNDAALSRERFLASQAIALALRGIPAIYFNSLFAARNDYARAEKTGQSRSLNRRRWAEDEIEELLADSGSETAEAFRRYLVLLAARSAHPAFHPDGEERVVDLGERLFALERTSPGREERILAVTNLTAGTADLPRSGLRAAGCAGEIGEDLLGGALRRERGAEASLAPYQTRWLPLRC